MSITPEEPEPDDPKSPPGRQPPHPDDEPEKPHPEPVRRRPGEEPPSPGDTPPPIQDPAPYGEPPNIIA